MAEPPGQRLRRRRQFRRLRQGQRQGQGQRQRQREGRSALPGSRLRKCCPLPASTHTTRESPEAGSVDRGRECHCRRPCPMQRGTTAWHSPGTVRKCCIRPLRPRSRKPFHDPRCGPHPQRGNSVCHSLCRMCTASKSCTFHLRSCGIAGRQSQANCRTSWSSCSGFRSKTNGLH